MIDQTGTGTFTIDAMDTRFCGSEEAAARQFARQRALYIPDALAPDLLATLMKICARASFVGNDVKHLGHRRIEHPEIAGKALSLTLTRAPLLRWVERVTGCAPIGRAEGRVAQFDPGSGDALDWHDDRDDQGRRLAITIDLSADSYSGGLFELRAKATGEMLIAHHHPSPGSALIFEVSPRLEHRVRPVESGGPRRNFAGWFLAPDA